MKIKSTISFSLNILLIAACTGGNSKMSEVSESQAVSIDIEEICLSYDDVLKCRTIPGYLSKMPIYKDESFVLDTTAFDMVVLETTNDCMMSDNIDQVALRGDTILIADYNTKAIYFFNKNGKFLSKINRRGRGPQEYINMTDVFFDDDNIYITDDYGKILCYDYDRQFQHSTDITKSYGVFAICYHDSLFVKTFASGYGENLIAVYSQKNFLQYHIPISPGKDSQMRDCIGKKAFIPQPNGFDVFIKDYSAADNYQHGNVVYHYFNGNFTPKYWIDFGKYNMPLAVARKGFEYYTEKNEGKYVSCVKDIYDTGRFLFFSFSYGLPYNAVYDKKTKKSIASMDCHNFDYFNLRSKHFSIYKDNVFLYLPSKQIPYMQVGRDATSWEKLTANLAEDDNGILVILKTKGYDAD